MGNGAPDDYLLMGLKGPGNHFFFHLKPYSCRESVFYLKKRSYSEKIKHFGKWRKFTFCKDHFAKGVAFYKVTNFATPHNLVILSYYLFFQPFFA